MTKFTGGEWVADIRGGCCAVYEKSRENDTAGMHSDDERNIYYSSAGAKYNGKHWEMSKEDIANAHLIAAAPDMYNLLSEISDLDECQMIKGAIYEVLEKARGEHKND